MSSVVVPREEDRDGDWASIFVFVFVGNRGQPKWGQGMPPFSLAADGRWYTCCFAKDLRHQPGVGAGGPSLKLYLGSHLPRVGWC